MGYSVDEIVRKLSEYEDPMSYDDILDAISQVNRRSTKMDSSTSSAGSYYSRQMASEYSITRTAVKLTDIVELGGALPKTNQPSMDIRERRNKHSSISEKYQATSISTDMQLRHHKKNLLDDLSLTNEKNTTFEVASPKMGSEKVIVSELNSFQQTSVDMNRIISDCSAIEINERSDVESDWLATNESNTEIRRALQSDYFYSNPLTNQQGPTKITHNQPANNEMQTGSYNSLDRAKNDNRQHHKVPSLEVSSRMERLQVEDSQLKDGNQKNRSAQMLKNVLETKSKVETPGKVIQVRSFVNDQPSFTTNLSIKVDQPTLEKPTNLTRNTQRPPLSTTCSNISYSSEKGFLSPQTHQKVTIPITKVSLGKNTENSRLSPSRGNTTQLRESTNLAKAVPDRNGSALEQQTTQTATQSATQTVAERNVQPHSGFQTKFSELLTSFNTFYNENSSLISNTDLNIINMINSYSIIKDSNNASKVGVCFSGLQSIEISDILIYPLLKAILGYVEVIKLHLSDHPVTSFQ